MKLDRIKNGPQVNTTIYFTRRDSKHLPITTTFSLSYKSTLLLCRDIKISHKYINMTSHSVRTDHKEPYSEFTFGVKLTVLH